MQVIVTPKAIKQYNKLSIKDRLKIKKKILTLEKNAFLGKKLSGELHELRSLRIWPYRILYYIDIKNTVFITSIIHRQGAYK